MLHLLHANPVLRGLVRGDNVQPIQDLVTLSDVDVSVAVAGPVRSVRLAPSGEDLNHAERDGRTYFTVPSLRGYQIVEISY